MAKEIFKSALRASSHHREEADCKGPNLFRRVLFLLSRSFRLLASLGLSSHFGEQITLDTHFVSECQPLKMNLYLSGNSYVRNFSRFSRIVVQVSRLFIEKSPS